MADEYGHPDPIALPLSFPLILRVKEGVFPEMLALTNAQQVRVALKECQDAGYEARLYNCVAVDP